MKSSDINQDGHTDLVAGSTSGLQVFLNDGTGNLKLKTIINSQNITVLAIGDITSDGEPDIIAGNPAGNNMSWRNNGDTAFYLAQDNIADDNKGGIELEDRNADSCPDLVITGVDGRE